MRRGPSGGRSLSDGGWREKSPPEPVVVMVVEGERSDMSFEPKPALEERSAPLLLLVLSTSVSDDSGVFGQRQRRCCQGCCACCGPTPAMLLVPLLCGGFAPVELAPRCWGCCRGVLKREFFDAVAPDVRLL